MGLLKRAVRRAAERVARRVAQHELFEKRGERAPTSPLPDAPSPASSGLDVASTADTEVAEGASEPDAPTPPPAARPRASGGAPLRVPEGELCVPVSLDGLERAAIPDGRPLILHHWATWCEPCEEELPEIEALYRSVRGSADLVGVCWELFDAFGPHDEISGRVRRYAERVGVSWPSVLYTGEPEAMFSALDMPFERIPQTRVIGADGAVLHEIHGPLDEAALAKIRSLLGAL